MPSHVVYRDFAAETVLLNLNTGKYHGLDPIGGRMLEALDRHGRFEAALDELSGEFDAPRERIAADMNKLCTLLLERGLLVLHDAE